MALSNQQYESIMRGYEQTRDDNRHILEKRREEVYNRIPEYRQLELEVSSVSIAKAKCLLDGDESALTALHDAIEQISLRKKKLLAAGGFATDYLEPVFTCPDCRDTGYINTEDLTKEKCHCLRQQELSILYEQSNIQELLSRENFSTLSYEYYQGDDLERFQGAVKICHDFVDKFNEDYRNLFFYGTVGTGKSFLSNCIANALIEKGHSVIYFSAGDLFAKISEYAFRKNGRDSGTNPYEDLYNCDLLVLDDLGTELTNSFVVSQLFSCLNERHLRRKSTVISTNLPLEDLRDRYSDRIFSRIYSNYEFCKLSGQDVRIYKKRMTNRK